MPRAAHIPYGPVIVIRGPHQGRVGIYDDDEDEGRRRRLVVYLFDGRARSNTLEVVADGEAVMVPPSYVRIPSESEAIAILGLMQNTYTVGQLFTLATSHSDGLGAVGVDGLLERAMRPAGRDPDEN